MPGPTSGTVPVRPAASWRTALLAAIAGALTAAVIALDPIPQDPAYHAFADQRTLFLLPNFMDVVSNVPFLLVGIAGLLVCRRRLPTGSGPAWSALFISVSLVASTDVTA